MSYTGYMVRVAIMILLSGCLAPPVMASPGNPLGLRPADNLPLLHVLWCDALWNNYVYYEGVLRELDPNVDVDYDRGLVLVPMLSRIHREAWYIRCAWPAVYP